MKKEEKQVSPKDQNNYGVWSLIIGMFSVMSSPVPLAGILFALVGFFLSIKQAKRERNSWSKAGKILSILGAVLSILSYLAAWWLTQNPEILQQIYGTNYGVQ